MSRSKIGVAQDGTHNAFARPGEPTLAAHHDPGRARQYDMPGEPAHALGHRGHAVGAVVDGKTVRGGGGLDIQPRQGKPKAMHPVSLHSNMHSVEQSNAGGRSHATATIDDGGQTIVSSAAAAPLADAYGSVLKNRPDAPLANGMRHRHGEVGPGTVVDGINPAHDPDRAAAMHAHRQSIGNRILDEAYAASGDCAQYRDCSGRKS